MISVRAGILTIAFVALGATPAFADVTGFIGANTTPSNRLVKGAAVGLGLIIAFEFEYSATQQDRDADAPALTTGTANALLQPPFAISGVQPYLAIGAGLFRERLAADQETGIVLNSGGGLKIALAGPLRLRLDYRVFQLKGGAMHTPAHRVYAGLNLRF
jgi:opacity protein-like surface antigen